MTFFISFKTCLISACMPDSVNYWKYWILKECNSIVDKLAAAMVMLAIRITYRFWEGCMKYKIYLEIYKIYLYRFSSLETDQ